MRSLDSYNLDLIEFDATNHKDFKVGQVFLCHNNKEVSQKYMKDNRLEVSICRCTDIDDFITVFEDFIVLEGTSNLTGWVYTDEDECYYDFYLIPKESHPEYYL